MLHLLLWSSLAALSAAAGPLLLGAERPGYQRLIGWANALAAGMMLGTGYVLMAAGLARGDVTAAIGASLGIAATFGAHVFYGVGLDSVTDSRSRLAVTASAIHSAPEGVAMGAAMALQYELGVFVILTFAVHNIWESAALASELVPAGYTRRQTALRAVLANVTQVAFALVAALLAEALVPISLLLGFAFGALVYLCLAELLPASYRNAGRTSIAVVASVAAGVVAAIGGRVQ